MTSAGPLEDLNPEATPPLVVLRGWRSAAGAAELRARVVELAVDLVLQEHDGRDHGERDQRDEEDVLHHRRTTLVLAELRLEPGTSDEQVHDLLPLLSSEPHARGLVWCRFPPVCQSAEFRPDCHESGRNPADACEVIRSAPRARQLAA